ncbi:MAG: sulfatase-like hydrolase/transferase, partial [Planctomycetota bacterium]|nr:sulfatase-like hydrolase/transferase [Planctomycetota bacterium]
IVADDLGWSDVGWHGGFGKTPNMDRLVREGVELDNHYVQPVCTPTRVALMSGRYPGRFGPHTLGASNQRAMPIGTLTMASLLKSRGYHTYLTGKWHLGAQAEWGPNQYGFDSSYGSLTGAVDPWKHTYRPGKLLKTWHRDGKMIDEEGNATELMAAEAVRCIEEKKDPWFIYVPFFAVHTPVDAPQQFKDLYKGVKFHDEPEKQDSRLRMAAMVSQLDAKIGEMVAALDKTGQRDNTLVIFTSDNGGIESLKNSYVSDVPHSPLNSENDPLRGQKATLYEGGVRVCAFANWPGHLTPRKVTTPMHAVDWLPTIASLVGYETEEDPAWDGKNIWPELTGTATDNSPRSIYIRVRDAAALRHGDWKLIHSFKGEDHLFNLAADPYEKNNLAKKMPEKVAELQKLLDEQRAKDSEIVPADQVNVRAIP